MVDTSSNPKSVEDFMSKEALARAASKDESQVDVNVVDQPLEIDQGVPAPPIGRRRGTSYPIDDLKVGESFYLPSKGPKDDPVGRLSSIVSAARLRYQTPVVDDKGKPVMEDYKKVTYKRGPNGKGFAKDATGHRIVESTATEQRQKMSTPTRVFRVARAAEDDPRGPNGARCFRLK
jgi:hypothetical protein